MAGSVLAIGVSAEAGGELHSVDVATLVAGQGIVGDRYYRRSGTFSEKLKKSKDWEVTLIEQEEVERFNGQQGTAFAAISFRRNIVTTGVRLNDLVGIRFRVGDAVLDGVRLCEPCAHLGRQIGFDVVKSMVHRAGLRARIVSGADVRPGDLVTTGVGSTD